MYYSFELKVRTVNNTVKDTSTGNKLYVRYMGYNTLPAKKHTEKIQNIIAIFLMVIACMT